MAMVMLCGACASIPKGQYGVKRIEWIGTKALDPHAIESCLVTRERGRFDIMLGVSSPSCGKPPFDSYPPTLELWSFPWSEWPIFDPAIFDVERERIERWYQARGYYDAHVTGVRTYVKDKEVDPNECQATGSDCQLKIVVELREGAPTYVDRVEIVTSSPLPEALIARLKKGLELRRGQRLDENSYENDKALLTREMIEASYARSKVTGHVVVDRNRRTAYVEYQLDPGPECVFGEVTIEGAQADVPATLLVQAANIRQGARYEQSLVDDAQRAIFSLNVFSGVRVERRGQGKVVDLAVIVQRGRVTRLSAGLGAMSGTMARPTSVETDSIPQWDLHLSGTYDNRNFLGGLRRLRLEERPRLILLREFPRIPPGGPTLGNLISARFEQPATFERRTKLVATAGWDFGPDPYLSFFRHDISLKVGLERPFWRHRLFGRFAIAHDFYDVTENYDNNPNGRAFLNQYGISSYRLPFLEQQIVVDLRDDGRRPRRGLYFSFLIQESSKLGSWGSWNYVRALPDLRVYVPLPLQSVLAARFAMGALFVFGRDKDLDDLSAKLGPLAYRFRGGGANSDRGFTAGSLGSSDTGGSRRYEGSIELRVPLGGDFGFVVFGDVGDVSRKAAFLYKNLNAATGFGFRYFSILGAIRFDAAWRIPGLQSLDGKDDGVTIGLVPSAMHLTIGEAF
jgi:outer membrane translocation and assembly module TamA